MKEDIGVEYSVYMQMAKEKQATVIDINKMADEVHRVVDLSDVSVEELEYYYIKDRLASRLAQDGYRSIIWGNGLYGNPADLNLDINIVARIINNSTFELMSVERKAEVLKEIGRKRGIPGQFEMDFMDGTFKEQMSPDELYQIMITTNAIA